MYDISHAHCYTPRATANDAPATLDFQEPRWREAYRGILPRSFLNCLFSPESEEAISNYWTRIITDGAPFWLADTGIRSDVAASKIVGIRLGNSPHDADAPATAELSVLYVHPEHQRQGIGTALLEALPWEVADMLLSHERWLHARQHTTPQRDPA